MFNWQSSLFVRNMLNKIGKRGPDEDGIYSSNNVMFGHKRLIIIDPKNRKTTNDM